MGYTHYWRRPREINPDLYRTIQRDMLTALELLPKEYPGPYYTGEPILLRGWDGKEPFGVEADQFALNGDAKRDLDHETFNFPRIFPTEDWLQPDKRGRYFNFCKTARKPYDLAVCVCLLVIKRHMGDAIEISSDGHMSKEQSWPYAKAIVNRVLKQKSESTARVAEEE